MTAWLFKHTRLSWWISELCPEDFKASTNTLTLLSAWGVGDQHTVWGQKGVYNRPQENKTDNKVGTNKKYYLGLFQAWKTCYNQGCMLKFLFCWSSLPGHHTCGLTASPFWSSWSRQFWQCPNRSRFFLRDCFPKMVCQHLAVPRTTTF